jgi:hypothetical protein
MAIKVSIPTEYGVDAKHWRIDKINQDFNGRAEILLCGYFNKAAAVANSTPLVRMTMYVDNLDSNRAAYYTEITKSKIVDGVETNPLFNQIEE